MRVVWLGTLALAMACLARPALAEPAAAPDLARPNAGYQLSYDAPADCPGQAAFEAALKVRLPAAHASLAADAIRLHVELASPGAGRASALSALGGGSAGLDSARAAEASATTIATPSTRSSGSHAATLQC